jgi:N-acyl-D-amino-acid deacylase
MYVGDGLRRVLDAIEDCRARGGGVWADSGVYTAFATFAGTPVFDEDIFRAKGYCAEKVRAATGKYAGQYLDQHKFREVRTLFPKDSLIYDPGSPGDIETAYSLPGVMVSTDCIGGAPKGQGHPQGAATYPLFFRRMVRETGKLSLLDAVRRCTLFPARALGYEGKGRLAVGADADIVVLDWERLRERAAFPGEGDPCAAPEGVIHVLVQGRPAIAYGTRIEGVFAGTCL